MAPTGIGPTAISSKMALRVGSPSALIASSTLAVTYRKVSLTVSRVKDAYIGGRGFQNSVEPTIGSRCLGPNQRRRSLESWPNVTYVVDPLRRFDVVQERLVNEGSAQ